MTKRGDPYKQKSNSFYGMTVKYLDGNKNTKFVNFQESITQIAEDRNQVRMQKKKVDQKKCYQCGITECQIAKLSKLEFYYDFVDRQKDRKDLDNLEY